MESSLSHLTAALLAGLTAAVLAFVLTPWVRRASVRMGWVSRSTEERWGRRVIARLGGVAMFAAFLISACIWIPLEKSMWGLLAGLVLVFTLGLIDDLRRMSPYAKLLAQLVIGCIVVFSGIRIELIEWVWLSVPLSVLWFVFCMNAFNLLDNMDGLAGGTGVLAAGFCGWFAIVTGQWPIAVMSAILCGVCLGFLYFNFPPAKIYMGDSGSHFLGLSLGALALLGTWHHSTQLLSVLAVPMLVLAVPIFDTCFVTVQRLLHHKHPFSGGTDHISHRLAVLGLSVKQTVLALYGVSASLGLLSVISVALEPAQAFVVWLAVFTLLVLCGLYLAQVKVYRLESASDASPSISSSGPVTLVETMLMHKRRLLEILVDFTLVGVAYVVAHLLRFDGILTDDLQHLILKSLPVVLAVKLACFAVLGLYRGVSRYVGFSDIINVFKSAALGSVLVALTLLYIWRFEGFSRSVLVIDGMLTFLFIGGSRVLERLLDDWISAVKRGGVRVLIFGAGDTGAHVLHHLKYEGRRAYRVIGFIDDDVRKHGNKIYGSPVIGSRNGLSRTIARYNVQEVLIAVNDPSGVLLNDIRHACEPFDITWRVVRAGVMDVL